jgi:TRAP-type C4-dicarboxylate transport system permease small subunit
VGLVIGLFILDDALIWETVGSWLAMTWLINLGISLVIMSLTSLLV